MDICANCYREGSQDEGGAVAWDEETPESSEHWFCPGCWETYKAIYILVDSLGKWRPLASPDRVE